MRLRSWRTVPASIKEGPSGEACFESGGRLDREVRGAADVQERPIARDEDSCLADGGEQEEHLIRPVRATRKAGRAPRRRDELAIRQISAQKGLDILPGQVEFRIRENADQLGDGLATAQRRDADFAPELAEPRQTSA